MAPSSLYNSYYYLYNSQFSGKSNEKAWLFKTYPVYFTKALEVKTSVKHTPCTDFFATLFWAKQQNAYLCVSCF